MNILKVANNSLSIEKCIHLLRESNQLGQFILSITREFLIDGELQSLEGEVSSEAVDQAMMDFRMNSGLISSEALESWLAENRMSYDDFRQKVEKGVKYENLRQAVAGKRVDEFFAENKQSFDRFALSRLVVADEALAVQLREALDLDGTGFSTLVTEHSIAYDRELEGRMGVFPRGQIPEPLQPYLQEAKEGDFLGPVVVDEHHCIFRVDKVFPAELNDSLRADLTERLFEEWMQEKIQTLDIQLLV